MKAIWVKWKLPHYPETVSEVNEEQEAADQFYKDLQADIENFSRGNEIDISIECKEGHPAKTIVNYAKENNCDLIVVGHKGHSSLWGNSLGHTTDKISDHAYCSVLIVR